MLHAFRADEPVRQLLHSSRLATKYDHFQATFMVEMGVQRGNDYFVMLVLKIGELLGQQTNVMIIDECNRAHDKCICSNDHGADEPVTNQITKRFGAVLIALVSNERIKAAQ